MNSLSDQSMMLIQKYFSDELSEKEKAEFDKALENSDFRSEVALQADVLEGIVAVRRENLQAVINDAKAELELKNKIQNNSNSNPKRSFSKWIWLILIMSFLAISFYYYQTQNQPSYNSIYAEYYIPYDTPESQRGNKEVINSPFDKGMALYENEDYASALSSFESVDIDTDDTQLLIANCYLNLNQLESAESVLKALVSSDDPKIAQHAEWYLFLTYIKSEKFDLARERLNQIKTSPNHLYRERIIRLSEAYKF